MMTSRKKFGLAVLFVAVVIYGLELLYFGRHSLPQSTAEAITDGIIWMLCGYSVSFTDVSDSMVLKID